LIRNPRWAGWGRRQRGGCCWSAPSGCGRVRGDAESPPKTEAIVSGQLALATSEQIVAAAVWETLPVECQQRVVLKLASLLAALIEAERDE